MTGGFSGRAGFPATGRHGAGESIDGETEMRIKEVLSGLVLCIALTAGLGGAAAGDWEPDAAAGAQAYGQANPVVAPLPDGTIICEAEEFQVESPGWEAKNWTTNYYAKTFGNSFLSRKAYLGAPEQCDESVATREAQVPKAGRYLALVRYEAQMQFGTQFRLVIEQGGKVVLDRLYAAQPAGGVSGEGYEISMDLQRGEGILWEGQDVYVDLQPGRIKLTLIAGRQAGLAARRNVDCIMLTTDEAQIKDRMEREMYKLSGMLTQAGDLYLKLHNEADGSKMTLNVPPGIEHSPYWVHIRHWNPRTLAADPGQSTDWVEVGSLLDTLNDGQWRLTAQPVEDGGALHYKLEFGVKSADGTVESIHVFESGSEGIELAYDANTRYTKRIRPINDVLYDLVDYLKKHPVRGHRPTRTLVVCIPFLPKPDDLEYMAARADFIRMMGVTVLRIGGPVPGIESAMPTGYLEAGGSTPEQVEEVCKKLQAESRADQIAIVSLGDEIGLKMPPADDNADFRKWLQGQGLGPSDVDPDAGASWDNVTYSPTDEAAKTNPRLYYYSLRYQHYYGIQAQKALTDVLRRYLPNAGIGFSYPQEVGGNEDIGEAHMWVRMFREDGMTMPWDADFVFGRAEGSQQMNFSRDDLCRAGLKGKPERKILTYVMPHWPGNTPTSWRRQFYGDIAHGTKIVNIYWIVPVQASGTENYVNSPEMYQGVRESLYEMGLFEDIMQDGVIEPGLAAFWVGETGDIWRDRSKPFVPDRRTLYVAILHQQLPLDFVIEEDALAGDLKQYKVLYLTDSHVSRAASQAIAGWVARGGRLFATAGAGMFDEFNRPNDILRELLGVEETGSVGPFKAINNCKEALPFEEPLETVTWQGPTGPGTMLVIGALSRIEARSAEVQGTFSDGSPAVTVKRTGEGSATYCAFLPGLSYFKPAMELRPKERGTSRDDSMGHYVPTEFSRAAGELIGSPATDVERPVLCSAPRVDTRIIRAKEGVLIPLVNWSGAPIKGLTVTVGVEVPTNGVALATGNPVGFSVGEDGKRVFTFDLDVADALILR